MIAAPFHANCSEFNVCTMLGQIVNITTIFITFPPLGLSVSAIILVTTALKNDYTPIHQDLKASLIEQSVDLEAIRHRHMDLKKIVAAADKNFSLVTLACLLWSVLLTCTCLYLLLMQTMSNMEKRMIVIMSLLCLIPTFMLVAAGTSLNEKVGIFPLRRHTIKCL